VAVLADRFYLVRVGTLLAGGGLVWMLRRVEDDKRSATYAKDVELCLVKTHVTERKSGEDA